MLLDELHILLNSSAIQDFPARIQKLLALEDLPQSQKVSVDCHSFPGSQEHLWGDLFIRDLPHLDCGQPLCICSLHNPPRCQLQKDPHWPSWNFSIYFMTLLARALQSLARWCEQCFPSWPWTRPCQSSSSWLKFLYLYTSGRWPHGDGELIWRHWYLATSSLFC